MSARGHIGVFLVVEYNTEYRSVDEPAAHCLNLSASFPEARISQATSEDQNETEPKGVYLVDVCMPEDVFKVLQVTVAFDRLEREDDAAANGHVRKAPKIDRAFELADQGKACPGALVVDNHHVRVV